VVDKKRTISLCMIAKNEQAVIGACLKSCIDYVDEVILVDTGSTDSTKDIAKSVCGSKLCLIEEAWADNFSKPRNTSFNSATGDWIIWLDADDTIEHLPELLKWLDSHENEVDIVNLPYDYARDEFGNICVVHWRERLLRNVRKEDTSAAFTWEDPIHEFLIYPPNSRIISLEIARVTHHREKTEAKSTRRNLDILEKTIKAEGGYTKAATRHMVYLGNEYLVRGEADAAIEAFEAYLPRSNWDEEALQVHCKLAMLYQDRQNYLKAYSHAYEALHRNPTWPDAYVLLAQLDLLTGKYANAIKFANVAMQQPVPDTPLILNPLTYSYTPRAIRYKANLLLGNVAEAREDAEYCQNSRPDEQTAADYAYITGELDRRSKVESVVRLNAALPLETLVALPDNIKGEPIIQDMIGFRVLSQEVTHNKPVIALYTGPHYEAWGPRNLLEGGIGGSETAAICVSRELSKQGADVTVYGEPGSQIGRDEYGVLYLPARHLDPTREYDVFISSRRPDIAETYTLNAKAKWLWLHDVNLGEIPMSRFQKFDRILTLSQWQTNQYLSLYGDGIAGKITRTENGIDHDLIVSALTDSLAAGSRDSQRFIYSSSPDRGLSYLLDIWPDIKEILPNASLDIYYGWDNFDKALNAYPQLRIVKDQIMYKINVLKEVGVTMHGRVSQKELYAQACKANFWVYPTNFCETSCITAKEMMACGVNVIASAVGALSETIGTHGTLITGSPEFPATQQKFLQAIKKVYAMQGTDAHKNAMLNAALYPKDWSDIAAQWLEMLP